jgi:hypothetical protein
VPTGIGIAFLAASLYQFRKGSSHLFGLLIFSAIFQAATIFSSQSIGLQPYYLVALFFLVRCAVEVSLRKVEMRYFHGVTCLIAFLVLGVTSAILYPIIFSGTPVISQSDFGLGFTESPLQFSTSNLIQAGLLLVNVSVVLMAGLLPGNMSHASRWLMRAFYFLLLILIIQFACLVLHVPFPYDLINNNQHYALANADVPEGGYTRPNGTFSEPSAAGCLMTGIALAFLARYVSTGKWGLKTCLAFIGLLLIASSGSLVAAVLGIGLVLYRYPIFHFPMYIRLKRLKRQSLLLGLAGLVIAGLAIPGVRQNLLQSTVEKGGSFSLAVRAALDLSALQTASYTYGIGVGLGSDRPASLMVALLSTVGIAGLILFLLLIIQLLKNDLGDYKWLKWLLVGFVLAMSIGSPDLSFPLLWITFALVARAAQLHWTSHDPQERTKTDREISLRKTSVQQSRL